MIKQTKAILTIGILIIFSLCILTSCESRTDNIDINLSSTMDQRLVPNNLDEYEVTLQIGDEIRLNTPKGISFLEDNLIVADSGNHRLVVIDSNGTVIREIGKQGKGKGEFLYPAGLAVDEENNIYVVDSGNFRVQVLDSDGNYKKEYVFKDYKKSKYKTDKMNDIAIINGVIYVSADSHNVSTSYIYRIKEGKLDRLGGNISGYLTTNSNSVYFVSSNELPEERTLANVNSKNGIHHLIKIDENNTVNVTPLPKHYYPGDICYDDEELYMISRGSQTIDRFDLDGSYIGTVYKSDSSVSIINISFIAMDKDKSIYLTDSKKNLIYKLERKK